MRTVVISDCHGRPDLITNALDHAGYDKKSDRLIFAGDIVDIGVDALKCIDVLHENEAELLWGNHDLAVVTGSSIWPQNPLDWRTKERIMAMVSEFKFVSVVNDVLITHAGVSQSYYDREISHALRRNPWDFDTGHETEDMLNIIDHVLSHASMREVWAQDGPLWYRPTKDNVPFDGVVQVVGHTPPAWINQTELTLNNFYTVDPYSKVGFGKDRFRYVTIEGYTVKLIDSNEV